MNRELNAVPALPFKQQAHWHNEKASGFQCYFGDAGAALAYDVVTQI